MYFAEVQDVDVAEMWRNHQYCCQLSANPKNGALVECRRMAVPGRKGLILGREAVRCGLVCCSCCLTFRNYDCLQFHMQSCVEAHQQGSTEDAEHIVHMGYEQLKCAKVSRFGSLYPSPSL